VAFDPAKRQMANVVRVFIGLFRQVTAKEEVVEIVEME